MNFEKNQKKCKQVKTYCNNKEEVNAIIDSIIGYFNNSETGITCIVLIGCSYIFKVTWLIHRLAMLKMHEDWNRIVIKAVGDYCNKVQKYRNEEYHNKIR